MDSDDLRRDARDDRDRADDLLDTDPTYADYLSRRADWREKLARDEETDDGVSDL